MLFWGGGEHYIERVTTYPLKARLLHSGDMSDFPEQKDCVIGDGVWIGNNVIVMQGVNIGNGAILGSGTIVTHDIAPYSVVVGVPGRVIRKLHSDDDIGFLENVDWYNWDSEKIADAVRCGAMDTVKALREYVIVSNE